MYFIFYYFLRILYTIQEGWLQCVGLSTMSVYMGIWACPIWP